jgi:hypothetical protein
MLWTRYSAFVDNFQQKIGVPPMGYFFFKLAAGNVSQISTFFSIFPAKMYLTHVQRHKANFIEYS